MHGPPGPAFQHDLLVIFRHTADFRPLEPHNPENAPVQGFVSAHAQLLRMSDGRFL